MGRLPFKHDLHHNNGRPIEPGEVNSVYGAASREGRVAWAYLRLAQEPTTVYRGKMRGLRWCSGGRRWRIATNLAFHANDPRYSFLCGTGEGFGRGVTDGYDEVLVVVVVDVDCLDPGPSSAEYGDIAKALANYDIARAKIMEAN